MMAPLDARELIAGMAGFVRQRHDRMREMKKSGRKIIGYFCTYTPEEAILAAGMHPVRIMTDPAEQAGPADAHLQNFACAFARSCLDQLARGSLEYLDGIVFPCTCDSLRAVSEIIRAEKKEGFFYHFLNMPLRVEGAAQAAYYRRELELLCGALYGFAGRPAGAGSLEGAIALADANRGLLEEIWDSRREPGPALTGEDCLAIIQAATCMDREELRGSLEKIKAALVPGTAGKNGRARLMLVGSVVDSPALIRIIESANTVVVGDDLCTGTRYFTVPVSAVKGEDPMDALTRRYLGRIPCPTKFPVNPRLDHISGIIDRFGVQGVVVVLQKFCESHAFDYPAVRDMVSGRGIPLLLLEVEPGHLAEGQLSTRIEAFAEMLGGGR